MEISELKRALKTGIPVVWQGKRDYERSVGRLTGIILRSAPNGEDVISCELTTRRRSIIICRPEELSYYHPSDGATVSQ